MRAPRTLLALVLSFGGLTSMCASPAPLAMVSQAPTPGAAAAATEPGEVSRRATRTRCASRSSATPAPARRRNSTSARRWRRARQRFPFEFVIMLGDNIYGSERPQDFAQKFEKPYETLLDAKVPFYAALGNHDDPTQRYYKPFNMNGERFYTFTKGDARFFALDSNYMDQTQLKWLEEQLSRANDRWKIAYFHHPLYSSGEPARVGSRPAHAPRAALHEVRRGRRLRRTRALLRAHQAAEGHLLLHRRAAPRSCAKATSGRTALDGERLRHRLLVHAGRAREEHAVPGAVARGQARGLAARCRSCPNPKRPADDKSRSQ